MMTSLLPGFAAGGLEIDPFPPERQDLPGPATGVDQQLDGCQGGFGEALIPPGLGDRLTQTPVLVAAQVATTIGLRVALDASRRVAAAVCQQRSRSSGRKIRGAAFRLYLKRGIGNVRQIPEQKKLEAEMMYTAGMRRIQIYIDEELDERLQVEAARTGRSKASLIRESVAARMGESTSLADDPLTALVGSLDCDPAAVDEVVYDS